MAHPLGRRVWRRWLALALLLLALWISVEAPGRAIDGSRDQRIYLIDYGFHAGIALPCAALARRGLFPDQPPCAWVEIGWGDEAFYRNTATLADIDPWLGLRALLGLGETVLHVLYLSADPADVFQPGAVTPLDLDGVGLERLIDHVAASLAQPAQPLGFGHWGAASRYYRSGLRYGPAQLCNHWVSNGLNAAGLPSSTFWSTLPFSLRGELSLRGAASAP